MAIAQHVQAAYSAEATHAQAIAALADAEAVIAYDISGGWPEIPA